MISTTISFQPDQYSFPGFFSLPGRKIFLARSQAADTQGANPDTAANDNERSPQRVDPVKAVRSAQDLQKLRNRGEAAMDNVVGRVGGTGWARELLHGRLSIAPGSALRRGVEDAVAREQNIAHGRLTRLLATAQRSIVEVGGARLQNAHEVHLRSRAILVSERQELLDRLAEVHHINSSEVGGVREFMVKERSVSFADEIRAAGGHPALGVFGKVHDGIARLKEKAIDERLLHTPGVRNLQRQIKLMDKAIAKLDRLTQKTDAVFAKNKAAQNLDKLRQLLKSRLGIPEEEFNHYVIEMQKSGRLPDVLVKKMKAKGLEVELGQLRRSLKTILFGTLGARHIRAWIGADKGLPALRQIDIAQTKREINSGQNVLKESKQVADKLLIQFGRNLRLGSGIQFAVKPEFTRLAQKVFQSTSRTHSFRVTKCKDPSAIVLSNPSVGRVVLDLRSRTLRNGRTTLPLAALNGVPTITKEAVLGENAGQQMAATIKERIARVSGLAFGDSLTLSFDRKQKEQLATQCGILVNTLHGRCQGPVRNGKVELQISESSKAPQFLVLDLNTGIMYNRTDSNQRISLGVLNSAPEIVKKQRAATEAASPSQANDNHSKKAASPEAATEPSRPETAAASPEAATEPSPAATEAPAETSTPAPATEAPEKAAA